MPPKKKIFKNNKPKLQCRNRPNRMRKKPSKQSSSSNHQSSNEQPLDNLNNSSYSWVQEQNGLQIDTIKGQLDKQSEQQRHKISQQLQKMINNQNPNDRNDQSDNNM